MGTHSRLRRRHRLEGYLAAIFALIVCGTASVAGTALPQPVLVGDLNTTPGEGSDPGLSGFFPTIGSQTLFDAVTPTTGRELWRTDGTAEGTRLVADLWPARESSFPQRFGSVGGVLFFSATDGATDALWRSDGSAAGTWRVSGLSPSSQFHNASAPVDVGGIAYFAAWDDDAGRELWRSDGTPEGTWLVRDIAPGEKGSDPRWLSALGDLLFFSASDGERDRELWVSDGTEEGTRQVADLYPGPIGSSPKELVALGDVVLFVAHEMTGERLWRVDATGTTVEPVAESDSFSDATELRAAGDLVYFIAFDLVYGLQVWRTDGTEEGTLRLTGSDASAGSGAVSLRDSAFAGGALFFPHWTETYGTELWRSDGTPEGTYLVKDLLPGEDPSWPKDLLGVGDEVMLVAFLGADETGLWRSDGTEAGTSLVSVFPTPAGVQPPAGLARAGAAVVFAATDEASGRELWSTRLPSGATQLLADLHVGTRDASPGPFTFLDGIAHFQIDEGESDWAAWRSDGSLLGTRRIDPEEPGSLASRLADATPFGSHLLFFAFGRTQLWKIQRDDPEPTWVRNLESTSLATASGRMVEWNGALWFFTRLGFSSTHVLWRTDGTEEGTSISLSGSGSVVEPAQLVAAGDRLVFATGSGELWASDGTQAGTALLASGLGEVRNLVAAATQVFFSALGPDCELWRSDGTDLGTRCVAEQLVGVDLVTPFGDGVLFEATDAEHGAELWWSDGSEPGTRLVRDVAPGPASAVLRELVPAEGHVFFTAADGTHGRELWKTDGTEEGTTLVRDIVPGPSGSHVRELTRWGHRLVFTACDDEAGCEPWTSDGTEAGTQRLADLVPGPLGSDPGAFESDGVRLVFAASTEQAGREVWWVPEPGASATGAAVLAALGTLARRQTRRSACSIG